MQYFSGKTIGLTTDTEGTGWDFFWPDPESEIWRNNSARPAISNRYLQCDYYPVERKTL